MVDEEETSFAKQAAAQPQLVRASILHLPNLESITQCVARAHFPPFAPLPRVALGRGAEFDVACGRPVSAVVPKEAKAGFDRGEGWVSVEQTTRGEEHVVEVSVYVRPREAAREGYRRLFKHIRVLPRAMRCWWRVCRESGCMAASTNLNQRLNLHVQPLSVDGALAGRVSPLDLPLTQHQLRSVAWMARQEDICGVDFICDWHTTRKLPWELKEDVEKTRGSYTRTVSKRSAHTPESDASLLLEWRIEEVFTIRGGVLADPVGSGKTLTCLVLCQEYPPLTQGRARAHAGARLAAAALRGEPTEAEFGAQLLAEGDGEDPVPHHHMCHLREMEPDLVPLPASLVICPEQVFHQWISEVEKWALRLDVIPITSGEDLAELDLPARVRSAENPVLVIVPVSTLGTVVYKQCKSPMTDEKWRDKAPLLRKASQGVCARSASPCKGLALEAFAWHRIVLDEFHELPKLKGHQKMVLQFLRAHTRWGVTGTPEDSLRTVGTVSGAAEMFHCQFNTKRSAEVFVENHFRTNRVDLPVDVEFRTLHVTLSRHERLIYEALSRDFDPQSRGAQAPPQTLARVVRQCSHFSSESRSALMRPEENSSEKFSDAKAAEFYYSQRLDRLSSTLRGVEIASSRTESQLMGLEDDKRFRPKGPSILQREKGLDGTAWFLADKDFRRKLRRDMESAFEPARQALSSFLFFHEAWRFVTGEVAEDEQRECAVCMESYSFVEGALLRCGHTFCGDCTRGFMRVQGKCPLCRGGLRQAGGATFGDDLRRRFAPSPAVLENEGPVDARYAAYGSKLQRVVQTILELREAEPEARILLYVQWVDLEGRIAAALEEFGVSHSRLISCKDIFERRDVLEAFQGGTGPKVLLLSLEQAASGAHLTAASHVFLVHPMVAGSAELMAAYEHQAVGRAVRLGQTKKVTVWRFVTQDTVEEDLVRMLEAHRNTAIAEADALGAEQLGAGPAPEPPSV